MPIRQSYIKNTCDKIMEEFGDKITINFKQNKLFLNETFEIQSNSLRNRIAGALVKEKRNENRTIIPPRRGKRGRHKGWKKKQRRKI